MSFSLRLAKQIRKIIDSGITNNKIKTRFLKRLKQGFLTREENPQTHFCVYFAAYDPIHEEVFLGHHKKSGLWLFNGGHIEKGEALWQTLKREIREEWGLPVSIGKVNGPALLTITRVKSITQQPCRFHYDIWYFIALDKNKFFPNQEKLKEEFFKTAWLTPKEARKLVSDPNTLVAIDFLQRSPPKNAIISL